jgi:hypothetical protein
MLNLVLLAYELTRSIDEKSNTKHVQYFLVKLKREFVSTIQMATNSAPVTLKKYEKHLTRIRPDLLPKGIRAMAKEDHAGFSSIVTAVE